MSQWVNICNINDILPATGVCALLGNEQVAIFRPRHDEQVYAWKMKASRSNTTTSA